MRHKVLFVFNFFFIFFFRNLDVNLSFILNKNEKVK